MKKTILAALLFAAPLPGYAIEDCGEHAFQIFYTEARLTPDGGVECYGILYESHNHGCENECWSRAEDWGSWGDCGGMLPAPDSCIIEKDINVALTPFILPGHPGDFLPTRWRSTFIEYGAIQFCVGWSESRWPSSRGAGRWFIDGGSVYTFPGFSESDCNTGVGAVQTQDPNNTGQTLDIEMGRPVRIPGRAFWVPGGAR